jgi:uncharacterized protein with PIN domain
MEGRPRFAADGNVGRLARWLRALGYDATFHPDIDDARLVALALVERRVLLTRDRDLLKRRAVASGALRAVLLMGDDPKEQLGQVAHHLRLHPDQALSRCLECNQPLVARPPEEVRALVPPHVAQTQVRFSSCSRCGRIYWAGTHWQRMQGVISRLG